MKSKSITAVLVALLFYCISNFAQTIDPQFEVGTWQGFRSSAISFTFDDNTPNQHSIVRPMFDQYGFKMTFYTVLNWGPNWTALKAAAANGHEVGSHTMSHPSLSTLTNDQQTTEYKNSRDMINTNVTTQKCVTIAYPNCVVGNSAICKQYYIAGRICSGAIVSKSPSDFMTISSIVCGSQGSIQKTSDFTNKAEAAVSSNGWVVFLIHAIDSESGYSSTSSSELKGALDYYYQNSTKFWVTSFSNAARYIKERNNISVKQVSAKDSVITCTVTDTLDNSIYNYPVTIRHILLDGWISAKITQNGKVVSSQIVEVNSKKYVMFDVVPDGGDIQIVKEKTTDIFVKTNSLVTSPLLKQNYPNPFNPVTNIDFDISERSMVTLKVYDVLGREITTLVNKQLSPGSFSVTFDGSNLSGGLYLYELSAGNYHSMKKLMLLK